MSSSRLAGKIDKEPASEYNSYMIKLTVTVEIDVWEEAREKYPNFQFNYRSLEEFAIGMAHCMVSQEYDTKKLFGFDINIVKEDLRYLE